jgi:exopolyphosphatase/guanosine-5'-triphosphate,3'-diphosphate pyrophosphatase
MPAIVPRWEWRAFADAFGRAGDSLTRRTEGAPHESDELYFLTPSGENVKVRDDLMDVKVLREVNAKGLEQWCPVMKAGFPLPAAEVKKVLEALHVQAPALKRSQYTFDEFTSECAGPGGAIRAVKVHKLRRRFTVGSCMAEFSDVIVNGRSTRTLAIESEDAAAVIAAVHELGFGGWVNTSYPKALASIVDEQPVRFAVIDVGTNSVKFHVGEKAADGKWRAVLDRAELTRLGEGIEGDGRITPDAITRTAAAIAAMVSEAKAQGARAIAAVGTAGLRMAANRQEVLDSIRSRADVDVEVISGEDESRLAFLGVQQGLDLGRGPLVVFDTGGGSSQFTFGRGAQVEDRFSVNVGAVRYTERFGLAGVVTPDVLATLGQTISADLSRLDGRPRPDTLVGMGGAVTNLTAVKLGLVTYDPQAVQGSTLDRAEIDRQIELYRGRDAEARRSIPGLQKKRAEVILAGACIVRTIMEKLGQDRFTVSDRGLRHGVLTERFGP